MTEPGISDPEFPPSSPARDDASSAWFTDSEDSIHEMRKRGGKFETLELNMDDDQTLGEFSRDGM